MNTVELIKQNIRSLSKSHNQIENVADKFEILNVLKQNLDYLKENSDKNEFKKEFGKLDTSVQTKWNKLTDKSLYDDLIKKFDQISEKVQNVSTEKSSKSSD